MDEDFNNEIEQSNEETLQDSSDDQQIETLENTPDEVADDVSEEGTNPEGLKEGFGREEYAKTVGNRNYYKNEAQNLRQRLDEARREKNKTTKEVPDKEKIKENKKQEKENKKNGIKNDSNGDKKAPTTTKDKNILDKSKDRLNVAKARKDIAVNKINSVKSAAYAANHPVEAAKAEAKAKIKRKILGAIMRHPILFIIIGLFLMVFILLVLLIMSLGGDDEESRENSQKLANDFNETTVEVLSQDGTVLNTVSFSDYIIGAAFIELRSDTEGLTDEQKKALYESYLLVIKSRALVDGGYSTENTTISLANGTNGIPYCSPYTGCSVYQFGSVYYYAPYDFDGILPGTFIGKIDPIEESELTILKEAQSETRNLLLVPDTFDMEMTTANYEAPPYSPSIKQEWISMLDTYTDYKDIIANTPEYSNYRIYNHENYAVSYEYSDVNSYWWPVGSREKDSNGLYSGDPMAKTITSGFGSRTIQGSSSNHNGIDISGGDSTCSNNVIIAARAGTVTVASDGCPSMGSYGDSCGGGFGNYVMIDHGDGIVTAYGHLSLNSITVKKGDKVSQGQMIGRMGSSGSSTGCHLHFEVRVNNVAADPSEYVSVDNPRPVAIASGYQEGSSSLQTVCLSFKKMGFSTNANAALLANIAAESGFNPNALGDSGTSYGLCQWHNGRWDNLRNFCGSEYTQTECQLNFLLSELQGYPDLYSLLRTNSNAQEMTNYFCLTFERPANKVTTCANRAASNTPTYLQYVQNNCQ